MTEEAMAIKRAAAEAVDAIGTVKSEVSVHFAGDNRRIAALTEALAHAQAIVSSAAGEVATQADRLARTRARRRKSIGQ